MSRVTEHYLCWVAPFGYLRINACLRLPVAFRSLLRPSSALGAKASTVCPYYLDFVLHSPSAELMQPTLSFSMLPLLCSCQGTSERKKISVGGDKEDRTPDLLLARQALSQLSYAPTNKLVGLDGLEPSTSRLSGVRSNQLSYRPACALIFLVPSKPNKDSARVSCGRGQFSSGSP